MSKIKFPPVPPEPAHSMTIKLHDDLDAIYTHIRDKYQRKIDHAFDRVSREIGFVVATTIPFTFECGDGRVKGTVVTDGLQGTLFDRELTDAIKSIYDDPIPALVPGVSYKIYLFWFDALKLKLRTDWMEPAHAGRQWMDRDYLFGERITDKYEAPWDVMEPAHWFDPGMAISTEEAVRISVIDEVYPELRLADRISHYRRGMSQMTEMSRVARAMEGPTSQPDQPPPEMLTELAEVLRRYRY